MVLGGLEFVAAGYYLLSERNRIKRENLRITADEDLKKRGYVPESQRTMGPHSPVNREWAPPYHPHHQPPYGHSPYPHHPPPHGTGAGYFGPPLIPHSWAGPHHPPGHPNHQHSALHPPPPQPYPGPPGWHPHSHFSSPSPISPSSSASTPTPMTPGSGVGGPFPFAPSHGQGFGWGAHLQHSGPVNGQHPSREIAPPLPPRPGMPTMQRRLGTDDEEVPPPLPPRSTGGSE